MGWSPEVSGQGQLPWSRGEESLVATREEVEIRMNNSLVSFPIKRSQEMRQNLERRVSQRDFPGGTVVGSPPANAGDMGLIAGPGRSHMPWSNEARVPQLLSLRSRAHEPQLLSLCATTTEAHAPRAHARNKRNPRLPQLEKTRVQQQRPNAAKNKLINFKKKSESRKGNFGGNGRNRNMFASY